MDFSAYHQLNLIIVLCFVILLAGEVIFTLNQRREEREMSLKETSASLSVGVFFTATNLITSAIYVAYFSFLYAITPFNLPSLWESHLSTGAALAVTVFVAFIWTDFTYYWGHRAGHRIRLLWASHSVHHSSEEFNYSTAGRLSPLDHVSGFVLNAPLVFLGVNPAIVLAVGLMGPGISLFFHTQHVGKLPRPIEFLFNSPSHHRVHHASQKQYLDRNMGGILMIWDRMFGTYAEEQAGPRYGLTKSIDTHNPAKIEVHEWRHMIGDFRRATSVRQRIAVLFKAPGAVPLPARGTPEPSASTPIATVPSSRAATSASAKSAPAKSLQSV